MDATSAAVDDMFSARASLFAAAADLTAARDVQTRILAEQRVCRAARCYARSMEQVIKVDLSWWRRVLWRLGLKRA